MLRALNTSATGMQAQQQKLDGIANNMANVNTTGFKKDRVDFEDLLYQTVKEAGTPAGPDSEAPVGIQVGTGVRVNAIHKEHTQGSPRHTGQNSDLMIDGDGYFGIQRPNGELAYTRNGAFSIDKNGTLTTKSGDPVQPGIQIPANALSFNVARNGIVTVAIPGQNQLQEAGKVELFNFTNPTGLTSISGSAFKPSTASGPPIQGTAGENGFGELLQGHLEASNVNVVEEMTDMIKTQRAYEMNSKVMGTADQMLQITNNIK